MKKINYNKIQELINKIKNLIELKQNWDSYGADLISEKVINKTIDIVYKLWEKYYVYFDYVFSGRNNNIQFDLDGKYNSVELEIDENKNIFVIYDDKDNVIEEKEIKEEKKDFLFIANVINMIKNDIIYENRL